MALTRPTTTAEPTAPDADEQITSEGVKTLADNAPAEAPEETQAAEETQAEKPPAEEPSAPASTEVAQRPAATPPAESHATDKARFEHSMADAGFEGLKLGGMSFETIRMPGDGIFIIGQDEQQLGKSFDCVVQRSVNKYVVRQHEGEDADMFYSYDPSGRVNTDGEDMAEKFKEWRIDGYDKPVIKTYLEVMAILLDVDEDGNEGERHRMMVSLSISPASVEKFSGFAAQQQYMKRLLPNQYITRCMVGDKIKGKSNSFYPWVFKNVGPAPELF